MRISIKLKKKKKTYFNRLEIIFFCLFIYKNVCVFFLFFIDILISECTYIHTYMYMYMNVCMCIYVYVYMYICVCVLYKMRVAGPWNLNPFQDKSV